MFRSTFVNNRRIWSREFPRLNTGGKDNGFKDLWLLITRVRVIFRLSSGECFKQYRCNFVLRLRRLPVYALTRCYKGEVSTKGQIRQQFGSRVHARESRALGTWLVILEYYAVAPMLLRSSAYGFFEIVTRVPFPRHWTISPRTIEPPFMKYPPFPSVSPRFLHSSDRKNVGAFSVIGTVEIGS